MTKDKNDQLRIAMFLRTVRGILNCSQKDFAKLVGVPQSTITRIEICETNMNLDEFIEIEKVVNHFGISFNISQIPFTFEIDQPAFDHMVDQIEAKQRAKDARKELKMYYR